MTRRPRRSGRPGSSAVPRVLITGGAGFIGSHLCDHFLAKGFEVVCAMDWKEARPLVTHPVSCVDCHDPKTTQLRVTRPAFLLGIARQTLRLKLRDLG